MPAQLLRVQCLDGSTDEKLPIHSASFCRATLYLSMTSRAAFI
jgi:hypothetical protein